MATGWKTDRMSKTDLILIRIALYEMIEDDEVPTGVAINEAVELANVTAVMIRHALLTVCLQSSLSKDFGGL